MERITMSIDEALAREFDALIGKRGYGSRFEAMRDLLRREVETERLTTDRKSFCVANLSYVYNHGQRDLIARLTALQHVQHDLVVAATHVHLDHEHCLETSLLKGPTGAVRALADRLRAERGVRHGQVNIITVEPTDKHARQSGCHHHDGRMHLVPRS
jgi:CopG family nickel-responsive transcriptional regulator